VLDWLGEWLNKPAAAEPAPAVSVTPGEPTLAPPRE
jgi:hypothetical protein